MPRFKIVMVNGDEHELDAVTYMSYEDRIEFLNGTEKLLNLQAARVDRIEQDGVVTTTKKERRPRVIPAAPRR